MATAGSFSDMDKSGEAARWAKGLDYISGTAGVIQSRADAMKVLQIANAKNVLVVGAGLGDDVRQISQYMREGGVVTGIDLSAEFVEMAQQKADDPKQRYMVMDATQMDFPNHSFDRIYINRVLHHVPDYEKALQECERVLKPGGIIVVCEPDYMSAVISSVSDKVTRIINQGYCDSIMNPRMGARLLSSLKKLGFKETLFQAYALIFRDYELWDELLGIEGFIDKAVAANQLTEDEAKTAKQALKQADEKKTFTYSQMIFLSCWVK